MVNFLIGNLNIFYVYAKRSTETALQWLDKDFNKSDWPKHMVLSGVCTHHQIKSLSDHYYIV